MFLIATAIVVVVVVEGLFIAFSTWWFMVIVLLLVIGAAIGVSMALVRLIDQDTPVAAPRRVAAESPAPARPRPVAQPRSILH